MVLVLFVPIVVFGAYKIYNGNLGSLPVLGPHKLLPKGKSELVKVPDYRFTDQNAKTFTEKQVAGKIVLYSFFFASCPEICPSMNRNLQSVQQVYIKDDNVAFVSFSIDPERDTPEKLAEYSAVYSLNQNQWHFLTGDKKKTYLLASQGFNVTATDGDGGPQDMIHSQTIMMVDPNKQIRGLYEGTEAGDMPRLIKDIKRLKKEFDL